MPASLSVVPPASAAPSPEPHLLLRNLPQLWGNPIPSLIDSTQRFGDITRYDCGIFDALLVNDADAVQHVLQKNYRNYKKSRTYRGLRLVLGDGLLTSEGDFWRRQRKLAQPAFHHRALASFADTMVDHSESMLARWSDGDCLDVHAEMSKLTFRIVGSTLFGADVEQYADAIGPALDVVIHHAYEYAEQVVPLPPWVPTLSNFRFRRAMRVLDGLVQELIQARRGQTDAPRDLLGMLMAATDESGTERMTDKQLRDEVLTLVLAGHETTANALTFTWYLLSRHPDVRRRLESEIDRVLGGRAPTLADLPQLTFTERVIQESMRLYPPAWVLEREAIEPDELCGYAVKRGSVVVISPFTLHRYSRYWENPEGFDPDRFDVSRSTDRHRFAYLPFGGGPRACIGNGFAMMEAKLLVATIAQRFRLELAAGYSLELDPSITLRPLGGMPIELNGRSS